MPHHPRLPHSASLTCTLSLAQAPASIDRRQRDPVSPASMARNARGRKRPPSGGAEESEGEGEGATAADAGRRPRTGRGAEGGASGGPSQQDAPEVRRTAIRVLRDSVRVPFHCAHTAISLLIGSPARPPRNKVMRE